MPVVFSKDMIQTDIDLDVLKRNGYGPLHWGTVIECYKKGDDLVYHHTKKNVFFKRKKPSFKVIVAGGRDFNDYDLLKRTLDFMLQNIRTKMVIEIVEGECRGADLLGKRYAKENGYTWSEFPADWDGLGRRAGHVRNEQMAKYANACVCFWDKKSPGTKGMIDLAKQYKLKLKEVYYNV